MKELYLSENKTEQTPFVHFKTNGELKIEGMSYPEDPMKFYRQIIEWIKELKKEGLPKIELSVRLDYFNTSTGKIVLSIFKSIENIYLTDKNDVKIIWYYHGNDEDMIESGKDYKSLLDVPFEMVETKAAKD